MNTAFILVLVIPAFAAFLLFSGAQSDFADKHKLNKVFVRVAWLLVIFIAFILANAFYLKWFVI